MSSKNYSKGNSKKVTFYLENDVNDMLDAVVYITKRKKVHLLNEATKFFIEKIIKEDDLKEKIEVMLK